MKKTLFIFILIILFSSICVSGCLESTPVQNPTPVAPLPQNDTNTPIKYAKLEGTFTITSADFSENSSKTLASDGHGNKVRWVIDGNNRTGGMIHLEYYGKEVSAYIPKIYYPSNQTYSYSCTESGYSISMSSGGGRYSTSLINGEWGSL
ncbi:MAG: hypothetical protein Q4P17_04025 [Methanobacterium sp.]|nr:hypothetical protein [Methanobacterium sp.]